MKSLLGDFARPVALAAGRFFYMVASGEQDTKIRGGV